VVFYIGIKNDYDNKNSIIKTPRQFLEEELEIYSYDTDIMKTKQLADMFFIYDYYNTCEIHKNINKEAQEIEYNIQLELTKYHGLKIKKDSTEIKSKKDNKYKIKPFNEWIKENNYSKDDFEKYEIDFNIFEGEKAYLSDKAIKNKYKLISKYIRGEDPKYKTLIYKP